MKKYLKIIGIGIGLLIFVVAVFLIFVAATDIPSYNVEKIDFNAKITPKTIERGKKLTMMLCANCHMHNQTRKLTGKRMLDAPPEFGIIYSQNITQDKVYGIGNWSDGELLYFFRTGIKKNGQYSPPYMSKMPNMADEDINAIIAFLRSNDPIAAADTTPDIPSQSSFLTKLLCRITFKPFPMPTEKIELPGEEYKLKLGKYLAHNLECFSCHSADFKTNNYLDPTLSEGYFAGGNKPLDDEGRAMLTPNLTPDKVTGIGNWTKEAFANAVKYGLIEGEKALQYPITPYSQLSDIEAETIFEYLKTIPAITNEIERSVYD